MEADRLRSIIQVSVCTKAACETASLSGLKAQEHKVQTIEDETKCKQVQMVQHWTSPPCQTDGFECGLPAASLIRLRRPRSASSRRRLRRCRWVLSGCWVDFLWRLILDDLDGS